MGDYEAACAGTGPGVLGWKCTAQLCGRVWAGCPSLHSSTLAVPQLPRHYSMDGTMCACSATTMLLLRQNITSCHSCSCKRGMEEGGPSVHIIRVEWSGKGGVLAPSRLRDLLQEGWGSPLLHHGGALGLLLSSTAPKPCSPPSCLTAPPRGAGRAFVFCWHRSMWIPAAKWGGEVKPKAVESGV